MSLIQILLFLIFIILSIIISILVSSTENSNFTGGTEYNKKRSDKRLGYKISSFHNNLIDYYKHETDTEYVTNTYKYTNKDKNYRLGGAEISNPKKWQDYTSWTKLYNDPGMWQSYLRDRKQARYNFLFDWTLVLEKVMPIVKTKSEEYIGIIKAKPDKKTLYVDSMESSNSNKRTSSYYREIGETLVQKYMKIPGYFMFHTHPDNPRADPMPSDADIYSALHHSLDKHYVGEVIVSSYGILIYYLNDNRFEKLYKEGGRLAFYTFCYDVIMAWNSINSVEKIRIQERLSFLEKFGITMEIIPSYKYVSDNHTKNITPEVLCDRFIDTKYHIMEMIKEIVKREEYKESKKYKY